MFNSNIMNKVENIRVIQMVNKRLMQKRHRPIAVDNVFIIETKHQVVDNKGRRDIDLKSSGKGYLLQKGKVNEVEWANKGGRIVPVLNGIEVGLVPGKTWINIIPNQPGLTEKVTLNATGK